MMFMLFEDMFALVYFSVLSNSSYDVISESMYVLFIERLLENLRRELYFLMFMLI